MTKRILSLIMAAVAAVSAAVPYHSIQNGIELYFIGTKTGGPKPVYPMGLPGPEKISTLMAKSDNPNAAALVFTIYYHNADGGIDRQTQLVAVDANGWATAFFYRHTDEIDGATVGELVTARKEFFQEGR